MIRRRPRREANSAFSCQLCRCRPGPPQAAAGGVTEAFLPANGFVTNPSRAQGGHLWWHRSADGSVCIGTVIVWVQYNATAAKTWRVIVYSARHPAA